MVGSGRCVMARQTGKSQRDGQVDGRMDRLPDRRLLCSAVTGFNLCSES